MFSRSLRATFIWLELLISVRSPPLEEAIAEQIQKHYRVIEDLEIGSYLSRIGQRLLSHLPLNKLRFQFFIVDLPDANPFVLPGVLTANQTVYVLSISLPD